MTAMNLNLSERYNQAITNEIKIIKHDNAITVSKELQPNEKCKIGWEIVVDTKEITELNVKTVKNILKSVTVSMDNSNYTYYQN